VSFSPKRLIISQVVGGAALLLALYTTTTCEFMMTKLTYIGMDPNTKTEIGLGMYSRQSSMKGTDSCVWFDDDDFETLFDWPFIVAVTCNSVATAIGCLNALLSLIMWCSYMSRFAIRFFTTNYILCAIFGGLSQLIYLTDSCFVDKCNVLPDGTVGTFCFQSRCSIGKGSIVSIFAVLLWISAAVLTFRLQPERGISARTNATSSLRSRTVPTTRILSNESYEFLEIGEYNNSVNLIEKHCAKSPSSSSSQEDSIASHGYTIDETVPEEEDGTIDSTKVSSVNILSLTREDESECSIETAEEQNFEDIEVGANEIQIPISPLGTAGCAGDKSQIDEEQTTIEIVQLDASSLPLHDTAITIVKDVLGSLTATSHDEEMEIQHPLNSLASDSNRLEVADRSLRPSFMDGLFNQTTSSLLPLRSSDSDASNLSFLY